MTTGKAAMRGERICGMELDLTGVADYGMSMEAIFARQESVPLHGARLDG